MLGNVSFGNKRNFEQFKNQIPNSILPLFEEMREFCFSLGDNIIEDIRMHRVVFCKSMTFRWFADLQPSEDGIILKIQKNRKQPVEIIKILKDGDTTRHKEIIQNAFNEIH